MLNVQSRVRCFWDRRFDTRRIAAWVCREQGGTRRWSRRVQLRSTAVGRLPRLSGVLFELRGRDNPPTSLHRVAGSPSICIFFLPFVINKRASRNINARDSTAVASTICTRRLYLKKSISIRSGCARPRYKIELCGVSRRPFVNSGFIEIKI